MRKGLVRRSIAGLLFALLCLSSALNAYVYAAVFTWFIFLMTEELFKMMAPGKRYIKEKICIYVAEISFFLLLFFHFQCCLPLKWAALPIVPLTLTYVFMLRDCSSDMDFNAALFFPLVYVMVPMTSSLVLVYAGGEFYGWMLFAVWMMVCLNDVGAYVFGMSFGQKPGSRKLSPALSPKKSWMGVYGGVAFTFISAVACCLVFGPEALALVHWLVIALIISVFGILGDLFESLIKRHVSVKDAGSIMPGHGGALDRLDSMILVLPLVILYLKLIAYF